MIVFVDYAAPSEFESNFDATQVGIATNVRRPVRFHGHVKKHNFILRIALRTLGELIWSDDTWISDADILDPVITVHPDRVFFEAFSQDQSVYGALVVDPDIFETEGDVETGTTNIDFTAWLWGALGEMRSSRATTFRIGPGGLHVQTSSAGGRFEKKVDVPESWVRGFLQTQAAMGMPGTRLHLKPIDLLSAIRFLKLNKAKVSPRALRYEFEPNQDAKLILEPWEYTVPLEGAEHNYTEPKTTRIWGRRRLQLIEGLLPFADEVDVYLKGRALPSFYAVKLPGMTFVLGLTGWSGSGFTGTGGFDLLAEASSASDAHLNLAISLLREKYHVSVKELAEHLNIEKHAADKVLVRLCRQGRCMFDVETRRFRHRELFETPADEETYFPPDIRQEHADRLIKQKDYEILSCVCEETKKIKKFKLPTTDEKVEKIAREITYRDWRVVGKVEGHEVEIVVNDLGRIIFGKCSCTFFEENLMNQGPCEHMIVLHKVSADMRKDGSSSKVVSDSAVHAPRKKPSVWELDEDEE